MGTSHGQLQAQQEVMYLANPYYFIKIFFIYLFESKSERERARAEGEADEETRREEQTPRRAGGPMWDWVPGPRDHDLSPAGAPKVLSYF